MIVVGARFRALAGARAALRAIRTSIGVAPGDVGVRPLGGTRYEAPTEDFVLAGRFNDGDVPAVISAVHAHGGRVFERRRDSPRRTPDAAPEPATASGRASASGRAARAVGRAGPAAGRELRKRLRRPSPPLRVRTALRQRVTG